MQNIHRHINIIYIYIKRKTKPNKKLYTSKKNALYVLNNIKI